MTRDLINRVKKVNRQAALIMAKKLPLIKKEICLSDSNELQASFVWVGTPQGCNYWENISNQLGEK